MYPHRLLTGNAYSTETGGTGWIVGYSPWTLLSGSGLLHVPTDQPLTGVCVKWFDHPAGHASGPGKPVSVGRTLSILVCDDAVFRLQFSPILEFLPEQTEEVVLRRPGDFAAWGPGLFHRWQAESRCTILTVRWQPGAEGEPFPR